MKVVCMIPARMGSKRIPKKNIRILYDKPLLAWAILSAKKADCFDEIWVNGDSETFCGIAKEYGVRFYKRPEALGSDEATNDDFMYDFLISVKCDAVVQLLPTSPFLQPEFIKFFCDEIKNPNNSHRDALISIKEVRIECLYNLEPINFDTTEKTKPSQELTPVMAYACSPMAWKRKSFLRNYEARVGAYHGRGNANLIRIAGYAAIDIDTEEDWQLAEVVAEKIMTGKKSTPRYYGETNSESDIEQIVKKDGVKVVNNHIFNSAIFQLNQYIKLKNILGESWSTLLIKTHEFCATAISQKKGEGNRRHYHKIPEFWYIAEGSYQFDIGDETIIAKKGSLVFVDKETEHQITSLEDGSVRLAISKFNEPHIYV